MTSLHRLLLRSSGSRLWLRLLMLFWVLLILSLLSTRLLGHGCRKRTFPYRDELEDSTHAVGAVLEGLHLRFFACYGSLWGQVHERRNPPWEADAELCILGTEEDGSAEGVQDKLVSALDSAGFSAEHDGRLGRYNVYRTDGTPGLVQLIFFTQDPAHKMYRRDGWLHRSLSISCREPLDPRLHCFPARLVAPPLEKHPFGKHLLPMPWLGFELQKYLFPNSWFRDYSPCA